MKMLVCSVMDKATGAFMQPFFVRTKPEAIRVFADAVNDTKTQFAAHPGDYDLYGVADWDDSTGSFANAEGAIRLVTGLECVKRPD